VASPTAIIARIPRARRALRINPVDQLFRNLSSDPSGAVTAATADASYDRSDERRRLVDIGKPLRIYTIEPVEDPVPHREPEPRPERVPLPRPKKEPDPAQAP
jgi:hypothetical protein